MRPWAFNVPGSFWARVEKGGRVCALHDLNLAPFARSRHSTHSGSLDLRVFIPSVPASHCTAIVYLDLCRAAGKLFLVTSEILCRVPWVYVC
jgi:hypothetical protein